MMPRWIEVICVISLPYVMCHTMQDARRLLADKQIDYQKTFRPIANQSAPVMLYVALELVSIHEFDEVQETLTITGVFDLNWIDEYMKWNPDDYGGMTELVIESDKVWTPYLVLLNNVDKLKKIGDASLVIRLTSDGNAYYYPGDVLSASCKVDVTYYPWDRHKCVFSFSIWAHLATEIIFLPSSDKVKTTYFSENGEWTFFKSSVERLYDAAYLEFYLHLERKPRFVLVNVIIPIVFMAFLNTMIFVIPVESGERISYTMTVLLAIAVFLTLVSDNLPRTSSPMSVFSYYLLTVLIISICITLATIFNVRLYYTDDSEPVIGCMASFAKRMKCTCGRRRQTSRYMRKKNYCRKSRDNNDKINGLHDMSRSENLQEKCRQQVNVSTACERSTVSIIDIPPSPCYQNQDLRKGDLPKYDSRCSAQQENFAMEVCVSWNDVSVAFDKLFFAISVIALTVATTIFFLYIIMI